MTKKFLILQPRAQAAYDITLRKSTGAIFVQPSKRRSKQPGLQRYGFSGLHLSKTIIGSRTTPTPGWFTLTALTPSQRPTESDRHRGTSRYLKFYMLLTCHFPTFCDCSKQTVLFIHTNLTAVLSRDMKLASRTWRWQPPTKSREVTRGESLQSNLSVETQLSLLQTTPFMNNLMSLEAGPSFLEVGLEGPGMVRIRHALEHPFDAAAVVPTDKRFVDL